MCGRCYAGSTHCKEPDRAIMYTGLHTTIEEKERELAEIMARLGAEFVEPTDAEAVVEPTDAEAEDFA